MDAMDLDEGAVEVVLEGAWAGQVVSLSGASSWSPGMSPPTHSPAKSRRAGSDVNSPGSATKSGGWSALARARSGLEEGDDARTVGDGSTCFEDQEQGEDDDLNEEDLGMVRRRIHSLPLIDIMHCVKKGNQERRATELLDKMDEVADAIPHGQLSSHLRLVVSAKGLQPRSVALSDDETLKNNLQHVTKAKVKLPLCVQEALVARRAKRVVIGVLSHPSEQNFNELLQVVRIWKSTGEVFDPMNPCLGALVSPWKKKLADFESLVCSQVVVALVKQGSDGASASLLCCKQCTGVFENMGELDLPDACSSLVLDLLSAWRRLQAATDSDAIPLYEEAALAISNAASMTRSKNVKTQVGVLLVSDPYYSRKLSSFLDMRAKTKESVAELKDATKRPVALKLGDKGADADLKDMCTKAVVWKSTLRSGAYKEALEKIRHMTEKHIEAILLGSDGGARPDLPTLHALIGLIDMAMMAFGSSEKLQTMMDRVKQVLAFAHADAQRSNLRSILSSADKAYFAELAAQASAHREGILQARGVVLGEDLRQELRDAWKSMTLLVLDNLEKEGSTSVQEVALAMATTLGLREKTSITSMLNRARDAMNAKANIEGAVARAEAAEHDAEDLASLQAATSAMVLNKAAFIDACAKVKDSGSMCTDLIRKVEEQQEKSDSVTERGIAVVTASRERAMQRTT